MARVLIAGCGDVGTALGLALADDGHEIWGLRRRAELLPAGIHALGADLAAPAGLDALPAGIDTVCYTAAAGGRDDDASRAAIHRTRRSRRELAPSALDCSLVTIAG